MRFNAMFADLVGEELLHEVSGDELPVSLRQTVDEGWTVDERGAWLLRDLVATYFGSPEYFTDVTGWEAAVNGRAIWDLDLAVDGKGRAVALARRGVTFARAALDRLNKDHPDHPPATAYVSISDVDLENEIPYEGSVTFVTAHEGERPYVADIDEITANAVLTIESADLLEALG